MSADQWLEEGNCDECRRQKYCSKPCKAHKIATQRMIRDLILEKTGAAIIKEGLKSMSK